MEFKHYKDKFKEIEFERYVGTIGIFQILILPIYFTQRAL